MIDENSKRRLTTEELYVYCVLCINRNLDFEMSITANVNMIHYTSPIKFVSKDSENKIRIRAALEALINKGYLVIVDDGITSDDIKNNTFFTVILNDKLDNKYVKLLFNEFRFFKTVDELFIYIVTKRFCNFSKGFKASYSRWSHLLNVSDRTAVIRLNEAEKRNLITIKRGEDKRDNQQMINLYCHKELIKTNS